MATLNVLKAGYIGKLGETYGSRWRNKTVIKAIPFSHAPRSQPQQDSVRAFECLNRIASAIAAIGFKYTGLSSKTMLPHNAVAHFLRPVVREHIFDPTAIAEVIPPGDDIQITGFTFNRTSSFTSVRLDKAHGYSPPSGSKIFLLIFDGSGKVRYRRLFHPQYFFDSFWMEHFDSQVYYAMAFLSSPSGKTYKLSNLQLTEGLHMRYSLQEQLTGDLWIDGKPVYQTSYNFTLAKVQPGNTGAVLIPSPSVGDLLSYELCAVELPSYEQLFVGPTPFIGYHNSPIAPFFIGVVFDNDSKSIKISYGSNDSNAIDELTGNKFLLTARYTKAEDIPAVGG